MITVIMPVYNAAPYLKKAIDSILFQSYQKFEFLIFNDASTDNSLDILRNYNDPRIILINSEKNFGYVHHLNIGIEMANYPYIARMDADDISLPDRFERQIQFLENKKDFALCGTSVNFIDINGNITGSSNLPLEYNKVKTHLFFYTAIFHPSVMIRTSVLRAIPYDQKFYPAEDYKIWNELAEENKIGNLSENLLNYRYHENNISKLKSEVQENAMKQVQKALLSKMGIFESGESNLELHFSIVSKAFWGDPSRIKSVTQALEWINKLYIANLNYKNYNQEEFNNCLKCCWKYSLNADSYSPFHVIKILKLKFFNSLDIQLQFKTLLKITLPRLRFNNLK